MAAQILRVSVFGTMPNSEEWSVNPCWEINGAGGDEVTPAEATTIATALAAITVDTRLLQMFPATTALTGYRVEARKLTGELETQAEAVRGTPAIGTSATVHPYQTSAVISLRTPLPGPSRRGRLYWPATGVPLSATTYRIGTTVRDSFVAGAKAYLLLMETAIKATLPEANLTVWSRHLADFTNVTSIQGGDVVDTQRRRRDTLVESYFSVSFP